MVAGLAVGIAAIASVRFITSNIFLDAMVIVVGVAGMLVVRRDSTGFHRCASPRPRLFDIVRVLNYQINCHVVSSIAHFGCLGQQGRLLST